MITSIPTPTCIHTHAHMYQHTHASNHNSMLIVNTVVIDVLS